MTFSSRPADNCNPPRNDGSASAGIATLRYASLSSSSGGVGIGGIPPDIAGSRLADTVKAQTPCRTDGLVNVESPFFTGRRSGLRGIIFSHRS